MATNLQKIGSYFRSKLRKFIGFGLKRKKVSLGLIVGMVFVFGIILFVPTKSHAFIDSLQEMSDGVMFVLNWLLFYFVQAIGWLVMKVFGLIVMVASYNNFVSHPAIAKGWYLMRDLCNMFFILILLVIAFSTILRVEKYEIKKMLPTLVISAVLVNFSKLICSLIIDFGQVVMMTFVNSFTATAGGNLMVGLGIENIFALQAGASNVGVDELTYFVTLILGAIMMLVTLWVVVSMLVLLVIRIVTLWFLVVTSPLAFLLKIMPFTSKHYNEWWQKFGWNVAIGPVFAFFLWLSLLIMSDPGKMFDFPIEEAGIAGTAVQPKAGLYGNLGKFTIAVGLLWAVFTASKEAGGAISSIGGKLASTGMGIGKSAVMRRLGGNYLKGAVDRFKQAGADKDKRQQKSGALTGAKMLQGKEYTAGLLKSGLGAVTGVGKTLVMSPLSMLKGAINAKKLYNQAIKAGKSSEDAKKIANRAKRQAFVQPWVDDYQQMGRDNFSAARMLANEVEQEKNKSNNEALKNTKYDIDDANQMRALLNDKSFDDGIRGAAGARLTELKEATESDVVKTRELLSSNSVALNEFEDKLGKSQPDMAYVDKNGNPDQAALAKAIRKEDLTLDKLSGAFKSNSAMMKQFFDELRKHKGDDVASDEMDKWAGKSKENSLATKTYIDQGGEDMLKSMSAKAQALPARSDERAKAEKAVVGFQALVAKHGKSTNLASALSGRRANGSATGSIDTAVAKNVAKRLDLSGMGNVDFSTSEGKAIAEQLSPGQTEQLLTSRSVADQEKGEAVLAHLQSVSKGTPSPAATEATEKIKQLVSSPRAINSISNPTLKTDLTTIKETVQQDKKDKEKQRELKARKSVKKTEISRLSTVLLSLSSKASTTPQQIQKIQDRIFELENEL